MAMTHDYLDYLNQRVGIAPANSQEELQAAQTIASLMGQHDLEPQVEEFDAPAISGLVPAVLSLVMLVGIVIAGVGVMALSVIGLLLALVPTLLAVMRLFGREPSLSFGPSARSQNVVAVHRACGPLVAKGNRPIVVVAHYDTPRESFLYSSPVAAYLPLVTKAAGPCSYVVAVCALLQLMAFIPSAARVVLWVVGIVAALPSVLLAVGAIYERVSACTLGANDNKSSVAAMLGVLENVRPSGLVPTPRETEEPHDEKDLGQEDKSHEGPVEEGAVEEDAPASPAETILVPAEVHGTRHGADVLRELEILPADCEIVYDVPLVPVPAPSPAETADMAPLTEPKRPIDARPEPGTAPMQPVAADAGTTRDDLLSTGQFSLVMDEGGHGVGPKDSSGLTAMNETDDLDATQPTPKTPSVRPAAPEDPEWGKATYRPQVSSVARRASLFDLPDPSLNESDGLGDPSATRVAPVSKRVPLQREPEAPQDVAPAPQAPEPVETLASSEHKPKGRLSGLLGKIKGAVASRAPQSSGDGGSEGWIGDDDEGASDDQVWRGGAAPRSGLRLVDDEQDGPTEEELREAALSLGDDALIAHDVWFVALGGSALDHAGMRAFLRQHRHDIRGAFIINLSCVGAGELSLLTREGLAVSRRADRRLGRTISNVARDLHVEVSQRELDWSSTDALPAMRSSMRSLTIMGMGENGLPALSRTPLDVAENVSGDQAALVADMVTEAIRRA